MRAGGQRIRALVGKALNRLPYLVRGLQLVWNASPRPTLIWAFLLVVQGLLPAASVNLTRLLVDSVVQVIQEGFTWANAQPVAWLAALMGLVLLVQELLRSTTTYIRTAQAERIRDYMSGLIHEKSIEIDLSLYDSPDYYDMLHRARTGATYRPLSLLENTGTMFQNGITLVAMLLVLLPYSAWLPLALLVSTLPAFYVVLYHRLRLHRWTIKNTADERRAWYYDWLLTARENAPEMRLFQLGDHFRSAFQAVRGRLRRERLALAKDQGMAELLAGTSALLVTVLSMGWMAWRVMSGLASLGDLAMFYQAFNQGQQLMRSFMENAGEIYTNSFFLADLFEFLALEPGIQDAPDPAPVKVGAQQGICFENISFQYPGSQRTALHDFSLCIQPGQMVAIVGPNGAGKSTLLKLLCRFYDPQEGSIKIDGTDLRQFSVDELRRSITVLFQEAVHYSATVRQNITLGDINAMPAMEAIVAAAEAAGADEPVSRLPEGYETLLGKWFQGGADLSVGEWQRLALARAFLRNAPIMILDEPTSAMDPWAEADWLERFRTLAAGRIAILITHRFTTAAHADIIYVMDQGQIVESGRHQELLAGGGRYATSWANQMRRWMSASQLEGVVEEE